MISDLLLVNRRGRRMSLRIHRGRSRLRSAALHSCQTKPCSPFEHDEDQIRYQFLNRRRRSTRLIHGTTSLRNFSKQKTCRCMKTSDIWHLVSLDLTCTHVWAGHYLWHSTKIFDTSHIKSYARHQWLKTVGINSCYKLLLSSMAKKVDTLGCGTNCCNILPRNADPADSCRTLSLQIRAI